MLLQAKNIEVSFGARDILRIDSLTLYEGERIGLVGENGAGKTTLLDVLAGKRTPDAGSVTRLAPIARIEQARRDDEHDNPNAHANGHAPVEAQLSDDMQGMQTLSGGERAKQAIRAAIASGASLLLADEPTNDLDQSGLAWLEETLLQWQGAFVLVSHDRMLLDAVCTSILALEDGELRQFPGNFSAWMAQREQERGFAKAQYDAARQEKARLKAAVQQTNERSAGVKKAPSRMGNSEARLHKRESTAKQKKINQAASAIQSRIGKIVEVPRPRNDPDVRMALGAPAPVVSRTLLRVENLRISFGSKVLLGGASFVLPTGSKTALLGDNGSGKTTLLRRIAAQDGAHDGATRMPPGVKLGFFDQDHAQLDPRKTALEQSRASGGTETAARTLLARLGLRGDDVFKRCAVLSGGERAKVIFAMLMLSDINLLLMDEPTNHLDIFVLPALEEMLALWPGTLLVVSHDRAFVRRVAQRLIFIENGDVRTFEGNWEQYGESRDGAGK